MRFLSLWFHSSDHFFVFFSICPKVSIFKIFSDSKFRFHCMFVPHRPIVISLKYLASNIIGLIGYEVVNHVHQWDWSPYQLQISTKGKLLSYKKSYTFAACRRLDRAATGPFEVSNEVVKSYCALSAINKSLPREDSSQFMLWEEEELCQFLLLIYDFKIFTWVVGEALGNNFSRASFFFQVFASKCAKLHHSCLRSDGSPARKIREKVKKKSRKTIFCQICILNSKQQ